MRKDYGGRGWDFEFIVEGHLNIAVEKNFRERRDDGREIEITSLVLPISIVLLAFPSTLQAVKSPTAIFKVWLFGENLILSAFNDVVDT